MKKKLRIKKKHKNSLAEFRIGKKTYRQWYIELWRSKEDKTEFNSIILTQFLQFREKMEKSFRLNDLQMISALELNFSLAKIILEEIEKKLKDENKSVSLLDIKKIYNDNLSYENRLIYDLLDFNFEADFILYQCLEMEEEIDDRAEIYLDESSLPPEKLFMTKLDSKTRYEYANLLLHTLDLESDQSRYKFELCLEHVCMIDSVRDATHQFLLEIFLSHPQHLKVENFWSGYQLLCDFFDYFYPKYFYESIDFYSSAPKICSELIEKLQCPAKQEFINSTLFKTRLEDSLKNLNKF